MTTSAAPWRGLLSPLLLNQRAFSSSTIRSSRRQVLVELLDDVQGLGQIYDRMIMNPGRARNELVPNGLARIVPWKRNNDRVNEVGLDKLALRTTRTRSRAQLLAMSRDLPQASLAPEPAQSLPTPRSIIETLNTLPPALDFSRRTISSTSDAIHGSLTLSDIATRLQEEHGLGSQDIEVLWKDRAMEDGGRVRTLGSFDAVIRVKWFGMEEAPLIINVKTLQE